jgi:predicted nuclease of predicted toxin-antitoxin system
VKLLADECIAAPLVRQLRAEGFDVRYTAERASGDTDDEVLRRAYREDRILLAEDTDFGELTVRLGLPVRGVVLLRMAALDTHQQARRLLDVLRTGDSPAGFFTVVQADRTRRRRLTKT